MLASYTTNDDDVLEHLCNKFYNNRAGALEHVLDTNRGLAMHGPVLPGGIEIMFTDMPEPEAESDYTLW